MRKVYLSGLVLSILLSGCGGGGGDGGTASTTPPPNTGTPPTPPPETGNPPPGNDTVKLIESFTYLKPPFSRGLNPNSWNATGNSGILYDMPSCLISSSAHTTVKVYSDASVETTFSTKRGAFDDLCSVKRAFAVQDLNDGKIEANYINGYTFYDQNSKIYYDVDYPSNEVTKLSSITNDGLTAVVQYQSGKTSNTKVYRAYKQINLSDIGMTPKTVPFFNQGKPDDIMELGATDGFRWSDSIYSLVGNLYLYKTVGVTTYSFDPNVYIIYNNAQIETKELGAPNFQRGYISEAFEVIYPENQKAINAQYVSAYTFYDSKTKVFYEVSGYVGGTDMIVDITNDGNTAVLQDGSIKQIVRSYKKVF